MRRIIPATLPLIATLAACGSPAAPDNAAAPAAVNYTDAATVRALPAGQRTAVFLRAIRDSGSECQQVTQAAEQDVTTGPPSWAVECDNTGRFIVAIGTGGIATVTIVTKR